MPHRNKKIVLPVVTALALALVFWLAFHDRSTEPAKAAAKTSQAARLEGALSPRVAFSEATSPTGARPGARARA